MRRVSGYDFALSGLLRKGFHPMRTNVIPSGLAYGLSPEGTRYHKGGSIPSDRITVTKSPERASYYKGGIILSNKKTMTQKSPKGTSDKDRSIPSDKITVTKEP